MNTFENKVKDHLKRIKESKPVKDSARGAWLRERDIIFGDEFGISTEAYSRQEVCYLLRAFPPCKMYKHSDSCAAYMPTNRHQKDSKTAVVKEVNPVLMWCDGLESYRYKLTWYTRLNKTFYCIKVIINYGHELVDIRYKYNDRRSLPKYNEFSASAKLGLNPIKYGRGSTDYMQKFAVEVIDKKDKEFFILQGE